MNSIEINGLHFSKIIDSLQINNKVLELAYSINKLFKEQQDIIEAIVVMNGACFLAVDLARELEQKFRFHFIKISSYEGITQNKEIKIENFDLTIFKNKNILIIEDIIESGNTLHLLSKKLEIIEYKSIHIVSLIIKPNCLKVKLNNLINGFEINDEFIVGYGMDYNGMGRGLKDIYQLDESLPNSHVE